MLLKRVLVVCPLDLTVNSVAAIPVNDKDISSSSMFLSFGVLGSNFLLNALPLKLDPTSNPTRPIFPYGGVSKYTTSPTTLKLPFKTVADDPTV